MSILYNKNTKQELVRDPIRLLQYTSPAKDVVCKGCRARIRKSDKVVYWVTNLYGKDRDMYLCDDCVTDMYTLMGESQ